MIPDTGYGQELEEARAAVRRVTGYPTERLERMDLGIRRNFHDALPRFQRIIDFFGLFQVEALDIYPVDVLRSIKAHANGIYERLENISTVDQIDDNQHTNLINEFDSQFSSLFATFGSYIAYGICTTLGVGAMQRAVKGSFDEARGLADGIRRDLEAIRAEAVQILADTRAAAAETSVSRQADFFKREARSHATWGCAWLALTLVSAIVLVAAAVGSLFLNRIPDLVPKDVYQSAQLIASKVIVFGVLSYLLALCGRNFMSRRHNNVVNRHRHNALLTFRPLVDGAADPKVKETILTHASSCIFAPQETGYARSSGASQLSGSKSIVELLPGALIKASEHTS